MKITVITQEDPFYLPREMEYLLSRIQPPLKVVSCVVLDVSPFGGSESLPAKALRTSRVFGMRFFARYCLKYVLSKTVGGKCVSAIFRKHGIPVIRLDKNINSQDSIKKITEFGPDLLVSIAGNQIFKAPLRELAPKGCINLHTSLLPEYRGLMPSFWTLKNGEKYTGVSVFFVNEGIDAGPIVVQKKIEIGDRSLEELILHSKRIGMDAVLESIEKIESGEVQLIDNPDSKKTYYSFPTRRDVVEFCKAGKRLY